MWAILAEDNETVIDGIPPTYTEEEAQDFAKLHNVTIVKVTYENGPAYTRGKWNGSKFLPPVEWENRPEWKALQNG